MNQQTQRQPAAAPVAVASTPAEIRKLAEDLMEVMSALLGVIERETELVRAGKVREAMMLRGKKTELSHRYTAAISQMKASQKHLSQAAPELLKTLQRHHDVFRAMLQINLTVLATAHAVSESIVRGVNSEMQRRNIPNTYTAAGRRAAPGPRNITPLSVSRSL
jgi:vacuolar-type H+-ATPase subunit D/Vma8